MKMVMKVILIFREIPSFDFLCDELEINELLRALIYGKEITSLTKDSFKDASQQLDQLLPKRLSQIQEFCQLIEDLESQRIHQVTCRFHFVVLFRNTILDS